MKVHKLKNRLKKATQRIQELEAVVKVLDFQLKQEAKKIEFLRKENYKYQYETAKKTGKPITIL